MSAPPASSDSSSASSSSRWSGLMATVNDGFAKASASATAAAEKVRDSDTYKKTTTAASEGWARASAATSDGLEKARSSELWQTTTAKAREAGQQMGSAAVRAKDSAVQALGGRRKKVTFSENLLGMTLTRHESGGPVVSRVDPNGAACALGVEPGDLIVSMKPDGEGEVDIKVESYEQLMGLFPAMGRPVTITMISAADREASLGNRVKSIGVVNFTLEEEIAKSVRIVNALTTERVSNPDASVPQAILQKAKGLAFLRVAKLGVGLSAKIGTGLVVAKVGHGADTWSAPCAVGTGGLGWGLQLGAELTDIMIVLNTDSAIDTFCSGRQITFGGNVGIAVGPVGRNAGASGHVGGLSSDETTTVAPCYSYSHSKGLFMGISIEGAVISARDDVNSNFYGQPKTPADLLKGPTPPPLQAQDLYNALAAGLADDDSSLDPPRYDPPPPNSSELPTGFPVSSPPAIPANPFVEDPNDAVFASPVPAGDAINALPEAQVHEGGDAEYSPLPSVPPSSAGQPGSDVSM